MEPVSTKGIGTAVKVFVNLAKGVGPLFLSQFDYAKFKYLDFKTKQAQAAGYAEYIQVEVKALTELKAEHLRDSLTKSGLERIKSEENVRLISKEINKLLVYSKVPSQISYIEAEEEPTTEATSGDSIELSETWLDRFNDLASKLNEVWRQELLAKAFAVEATTPGTIDLDTLFTIARLDQSSFYFFDAVLSISLSMYEIYFLPVKDDTLSLELEVEGEKRELGNIIYHLQHTGLLINDRKLGVSLPIDSETEFSYDSETLVVNTNKYAHFAGILTSRSGSSLAALCHVKPNETGRKIFDHFESDLIREECCVKRNSR